MPCFCCPGSRMTSFQQKNIPVSRIQNVAFQGGIVQDPARVHVSIKAHFMEFYLPGARPYHRPNALYEKLKLKEKEIMSFLHNLEMENIEVRENCQELKKEMNFYRNLQSRLLLEKTLIMKKLVNLKQESKEIQVDWAIIQQYLVDMNLNDKDEQEKTTNLQTQQHEVSEPATELELAPSQEESLLQNELPPQEAPAEL